MPAAGASDRSPGAPGWASAFFPTRRSSLVNAFKNLPIAVRLGIGFGALVLALGLSGLLSYRALGTLNQHVSDLGTHDVPSLELSSKLSRQAEQAVHLTAQHLYVRDGDLARQDKLAATVASLA